VVVRIWFKVSIGKIIGCNAGKDVVNPHAVPDHQDHIFGPFAFRFFDIISDGIKILALVDQVFIAGFYFLVGFLGRKRH